MILSTPGLVLHATPYSETSVVVKVFTRQLGLRSYIVKGVRGNRGRVKQNLLQPLSCLDMVVYNNEKSNLNYIKELSPRHPVAKANAVDNALCFFMTEVLYKALREAEPIPDLWDYVEKASGESETTEGSRRDVPIRFLLTVARHLGIEPMNNFSPSQPLFDLQEGRFVATTTETTLSPALSTTLHNYLESPGATLSFPLDERRSLIDALIAYYHLHLSGFGHFRSHEILHTILK